MGYDCHLFLIHQNKWLPIEDTLSLKPILSGFINYRLIYPQSYMGNKETMQASDIQFLKSFEDNRSGFVPLFLEREGIKVDIFSPYGGDMNDPILNIDEITKSEHKNHIVKFYSDHYDST